MPRETLFKYSRFCHWNNSSKNDIYFIIHSLLFYSKTVRLCVFTFLLKFWVKCSLSLLQNLKKMKNNLHLTARAIVSLNWMQCTTFKCFKLQNRSERHFGNWCLSVNDNLGLLFCFFVLNEARLHLVTICFSYMGKKSVSTLKISSFVFYRMYRTVSKLTFQLYLKKKSNNGLKHI